MENLTAGQKAFLDQMTRKLMVDWCDLAVRTSSPYIAGTPMSRYLDHAVTKKWLSAKDPETDDHRILSAGWETAARFLKR